jgi:serine/threonine protein kinase
MRTISGPDVDKKLDLLRRLKNKNILTAYEAFSHNNDFYVISEDTEVSLEQFIVARPDQVQLVAIISQVTMNAF